jgi:protein-disulfide isomerase
MLRVPVTPHDHIKGPADAPVTLIEYGDYECPYCGAAHPIVNAIVERFSKELRFVFRHFPMVQVHPFAETAAQAAEFAGAHAQFWEMHDGLYENQESLGVPLLFALAEALGLPEDGLREALVNGEYLPKMRSGVNGTPTFFVNGRRHDGTWAYEDLAGAIEARLHATAST